MFEDSPELQATLNATNEGERGAESLARMARALGYKDPLYFGQFSAEASWGDLIEFLSDNAGCVAAIKTWVSKRVIESDE